jgi:hypothetical protein
MLKYAYILGVEEIGDFSILKKTHLRDVYLDPPFNYFVARQHKKFEYGFHMSGSKDLFCLNLKMLSKLIFLFFHKHQ